MQASNYLGTERAGKLLLKFAVPCICFLIISCLYNIVDQIFVGNGVGYLGNAATGVIFPITVIGWGVSLFFGDGAAGSQGANSVDPKLYIQFAVPCLRIYLSLILFTCVQKVCAIFLLLGFSNP